MNDADQCRANGWKVGDRLLSDVGYGPTTIELTAIGESQISATIVSHNGVAPEGQEILETLSGRTWRRLEDPLPAR
jgi:hypothetical protein